MIRRVGLASLVLVSVLASGAAAGAGDPSFELAPTSSGWLVNGASASRSGSTVALAALPGSASVTVGRGERLYATTPEGRVIGQLNGPADGNGALISPLSFVVQANGDLVVAWRRVDGADQYELRLNDLPVARTQALTSRLPASSVRANDVVSVLAISSARTSDETIIGVMSLLVSDFKDVKGAPSAPLSSPQLEGASLSTSEVLQAATLPSYTGFIFRSFIPDQWVQAPLLCDGQGLFPSNRYFKGDNRGFSSSSTAYRTQATVTLRWTQSSDLTSKSVGTTSLYQKNTNGTYSFLESKTASTAGITFYGPNTYTSTRKNFISYTSVTNPFCSSILNAAIDLTVNAVVDRTAGYTGFNIWGTNDRAPNYELYFYNEGTATTRFYGWNRGSFSCLSPYACTQVAFSIVR